MQVLGTRYAPRTPASAPVALALAIHISVTGLDLAVLSGDWEAGGTRLVVSTLLEMSTITYFQHFKIVLKFFSLYLSFF